MSADLTPLPIGGLYDGLRDRVEVHNYGPHSILIDCPVCRQPVLDVESSGAVRCGVGCAQPDVERWLRQTIEVLPVRCPEAGRAKHWSGTCEHCLDYAAAAKALHGAKAAWRVAQGSSNAVCDHQPPCPTLLHHDRLGWRDADRWALTVVEGLADEDGSRFAETPLDEVPSLPPPRYFDLGDGTMLLRPGDLVWLHGMNAAGKSPTLDLIGRDAIRADEDCLWILFDYELGRTRQHERLLNAGLTQQEMNEAIYYVEFPSLLDDRGKERLVRDVLDKAERYGKVPRLMTWDTYSRSCSQIPGADVESNRYINAWFTSHPDWARKAFEDETGVALTQIIPDHPNKDDAITPGGGHAKQDRVTINLWLRRGEGFGKTHERGSSDYVIAKHAHGDYSINTKVSTLHNRIGPDGVSRFYRERVLVSPFLADVDLTRAGADPVHKVEAAIVEKLRQAREAGLTTTAITGDGGAAAPVRSALAHLVGDGMVTGRPTPGKVGKTYWLPAFAPPQ